VPQSTFILHLPSRIFPSLHKLVVHSKQWLTIKFWTQRSVKWFMTAFKNWAELQLLIFLDTASR
jgi:hypothetical protein